MVDKSLWSPSDLNTNLKKYTDFLKDSKLHSFKDYNILHKWSIKNKAIFLYVISLRQSSLIE